MVAADMGGFSFRSQFDAQFPSVPLSLLLCFLLLSSSLPLLPPSSFPFPLSSLLLFPLTQPRCLVCLRLKVQKVLQELKQYHG